MTSLIDTHDSLDELLTWRDGVLDTRSALAHLSPAALRWRLRSGRWQQPCRGVVVAHSGPLSGIQMLRVAVLWAGPGAVIGGLTAARMQGFRGFEEKAGVIHLLVPANRTVRDSKPRLRLAVHYSRHLTREDIHPAKEPAQTRIARSLVDAAAWMGTDRGARAVLASGVQQRLVRVADLITETERNPRLRRRVLIVETLADIAGGAQALSELDFIKLVVRQFGLPEPDRQVARRDARGKRRWLDAVWEKARVIAEIDGAAHLDALEYWDNMDRDNGFQLERYQVFRYPAWVVRHNPEYVADQLRQALRA
jgi:hypothetical protein